MRFHLFSCICLIIITLAAPNLFAQEQGTALKSTLSNVTIHLRGAELIENGTASVKAGRQRFIFSGLSPKLNPQSIQVRATPGVSILSITSKVNFLKEREASPAVKILQDSVKLLSESAQAIADEQGAFLEEKDLLQKNKNMAGKDASLPVEELVKAADFYRKRFKEINSALSLLSRKNADIQQVMTRLNNQLQELNAGQQPTSEVYVEVEAEAAVNCEFRLRYVVYDAGWSPIYDLVSTGLNEPVQLKYRALAFNDCGVDWNNVKIRLSTADPDQGAGQPALTPWVLTLPKQVPNTGDVYGQMPQMEQQRNRLEMMQNSQNFNYNFAPQDGKDKAQGQIIAFETIEISELSKDFDIASPYSIPADRKPYSIEITEYQLDASYKHFAVPKLDKDAFLLAQITGWEKLDLISGPINVYRNENFIGLAQLSTRTLSDTLELSLGRDNKVVVTRTKMEDFSKKQFLGGNKISSFTWKIAVKNNHAQPISIEINDQVPVSQNKEISVDIKEISNARRIEESGKLIWELNLSPGEVKSVQSAFAIKHPSSMEVEVGKMRKAMSPRYF